MVQIIPFMLLHVAEDNLVKNYFISFDIDDKGIVVSFYKVVPLFYKFCMLATHFWLDFLTGTALISVFSFMLEF